MIVLSKRRRRSKSEIERFYAERIVRAFAPTATFLTFGHANMRQPDVLYSFEKKLLGIEITGAYYSWQHAKDIANGSRPTLGQQALNFEFSLENADKLAAYAIRKEINKKANKRYEQVDEAWLGVHLETELSDERSIDYVLQQFGVQKRHPFKRIFLL